VLKNYNGQRISTSSGGISYSGCSEKWHNQYLLFLTTHIRYKFCHSSATCIYARWANNLDMVANTAENSMQMNW